MNPFPGLWRCLGAPLARAWHGSGTHFCPVCNRHVRRFVPGGEPPRARARCPLCGCLERHRLDWVFLTTQTDLLDGRHKKLLHLAPEAFLAARFRQVPHLTYLSADLDGRNAMVHMDITRINYPDHAFDVIYASHVLEHIPDDRQALAELYRVLAPNGWGLLQVPVTVATTDENPALTDPEERRRHFGQPDHVRRCGPDYAERLRDAGFAVRVWRAAELVPAAAAARLGFAPDRYVFFCRKPASPALPAVTQGP